MSDEQRTGGDDPVGRGHYGPDALNEVTVAPTDPVREAKDRDADDPADVPVAPQDLRNGGPTRGPGMRTTTGSTAGPGGPGRAAAPRRDETADKAGEAGEKTAPTTTGDATSGGPGTPVGGGTTSDNTTAATSGGSYADR